MLKITPLIYSFSFCNFGLGDRWAMCNYILKLSEKTHKPVKITMKCRHPDIEHIMANLSSKGKYRFVHSIANVNVTYCDVFQSIFCRTKISWTPNKSKIICYQLDGRYMAKVKNLKQQEIKLLFDFLKNSGYQLINVGKRHPLEDAIRLMSNAEAFIGIPSGMSHVACSVRVPTFIICKPKMDMKFHLNCIYYNKPNVQVISNVGQFMEKFNQFLKNPPKPFENDPYITML